ncbi:MAG: hypothetical protein ABUL44_04175 [Flavobacterium sp.]
MPAQQQAGCVRRKPMTQAQIQQMKDTETLILTKGQTFWHYSIIPFLLIAPIMTTIDVFKYYVTHTYNSTKPIDYTFGYFWILPALIFYFIQKRRLKFKAINISVDNNIFHNAVEQTAKELEWNVQQMTRDIAIAKSGFSWRSWGEQITILHDKDKILFNSICDPDNRPSVASFGMNKLNLKTFEQILRQNCA